MPFMPINRTQIYTIAWQMAEGSITGEWDLHWVGIDMTEKTPHNKKQKKAICSKYVSKLSLPAGINKMSKQCIKGPKNHFGPKTGSFIDRICLMLSRILFSGERSNIMYSTCVQFPLGSSGYWDVRLRTLCIFVKYLFHNRFPSRTKATNAEITKGIPTLYFDLQMTENKWPESFHLRQNSYLEKVSNNELAWTRGMKKTINGDEQQ